MRNNLPCPPKRYLRYEGGDFRSFYQSETILLILHFHVSSQSIFSLLVTNTHHVEETCMSGEHPDCLSAGYATFTGGHVIFISPCLLLSNLETWMSHLIVIFFFFSLTALAVVRPPVTNVTRLLQKKLQRMEWIRIKMLKLRGNKRLKCLGKYNC